NASATPHFDARRVQADGKTVLPTQVDNHFDLARKTLKQPSEPLQGGPAAQAAMAMFVRQDDGVTSRLSHLLLKLHGEQFTIARQLAARPTQLDTPEPAFSSIVHCEYCDRDVVIATEELRIKKAIRPQRSAAAAERHLNGRGSCLL